MVEISAHSRGNTIAELQKLCENAEDRQNPHVWSEKASHRKPVKCCWCPPKVEGVVFVPLFFFSFFSLVVVPSKYVQIFANLNNPRFLLIHFFLLFFRIAFNIDDNFLFVPIQDQVCPRLRCDRSGLYSLLSPPVR